MSRWWAIVTAKKWLDPRPNDSDRKYDVYKQSGGSTTVLHGVQQRVQQRPSFPGPSGTFAWVPITLFNWEDGTPPDVREGRK
jgi:hypothetical protein